VNDDKANNIALFARCNASSTMED